MDRESLFYFTSTMRKAVVIVLCAHIQRLKVQNPKSQGPEKSVEAVLEVFTHGGRGGQSMGLFCSERSAAFYIHAHTAAQDGE